MKHYAHAPLFVLLATGFTFADRFPHAMLSGLSERKNDPCDQECSQLAYDGTICKVEPAPPCGCDDYVAYGSKCVQCTNANPYSIYAGRHIEEVLYLCLCNERCPETTRAFNVCNDTNPDTSHCVCQGVVNDAGACYNCLLKQSSPVADVFNYTYFDCVSFG
jgi:hypothetical protein